MSYIIYGHGGGGGGGGDLLIRSCLPSPSSTWEWDLGTLRYQNLQNAGNGVMEEQLTASIIDALWYIDGHHSTLEAQSGSIPDPFCRLQYSGKKQAQEMRKM